MRLRRPRGFLYEPLLTLLEDDDDEDDDVDDDDDDDDDDNVLGYSDGEISWVSHQSC